MERTLILLKPDAVQRFLVGRIVSRFEEKGLKIVAMKFMKIPLELCQKHYEPHKGKPFYKGLVSFMTASPVVAMVLEGKDAIAICRHMMGATFGPDAEPGTIRGDFGISKSFNLVHGSDSSGAAAREIELFFKPEEIIPWKPVSQSWIYDLKEEEKD